MLMWHHSNTSLTVCTESYMMNSLSNITGFSNADQNTQTEITSTLFHVSDGNQWIFFGLLVIGFGPGWALWLMSGRKAVTQMEHFLCVCVCVCGPQDLYSSLPYSKRWLWPRDSQRTSAPPYTVLCSNQRVPVQSDHIKMSTHVQGWFTDVHQGKIYFN